MHKILNRIAKIISTAVFVVLVCSIALIVGYVIRVNYLSKNGDLGKVNTNFYTILTQSMYPTIKAGDVVITYKDENNKYDVGDVVTFISDSNGGITVTHRIMETYDLNGYYSYVTKGDNNNARDNEMVKSDNVLGKVILKIPKIGYAQQFLVSKTGWIVAVLLPCLGVVIYDILKLFLSLTIRGKNKINENSDTVIARKKLKKVVDDDAGEE